MTRDPSEREIENRLREAESRRERNGVFADATAGELYMYCLKHDLPEDSAAWQAYQRKLGGDGDDAATGVTDP